MNKIEPDEEMNIKEETIPPLHPNEKVSLVIPASNKFGFVHYFNKNLNFITSKGHILHAVQCIFSSDHYMSEALKNQPGKLFACVLDLW